MNNHAVRLLEFDSIRTELASYAWSVSGRKIIESAGFCSTLKDLEQLRQPVREFRSLLDSDEEYPGVSFPDIESFAILSEKPGSVLETQELSDIAVFLSSAQTLKNYLLHSAGRIRQEATDLPDMGDLLREIRKIIDRDGNIREAEIPSLIAIRRRILSVRRDLDGYAASYINNPDHRGYWQSDSASQKDGRLVLPLNRNFKGRIRGVVHEVSARGATVFFEPLDIFEKNNELIEEENEYRIELFRLLRELTAKVGARSGDLLFLLNRVGEIDSWHVRARYSRAHECFPAEKDSSALSLVGARHPLLGKNAVPITVSLGEDTRIMLISGPNTGGKTVALKTVGLLALMNQFGLDVPADIGSGLPLFDDIFVDIGDEQSISESLSTFSAHVKNLSFIVSRSTSRSLVLLDELGSGTDPEQGGALAMSFLDVFLQNECRAIVTSHLGALKNYAFTRSGVENASVDFDVEALRPTYRIVPGVPGASYALEIAEKYGAPASIIAKAKTYLQSNETDSARIIRELTNLQQELQEKDRAAFRLQQKLETKEADLKRREDEAALKELSLRTEGTRDLETFLSESRRNLEDLVRRLKEGEITKEKTRESREFVDTVRKKIDVERTGIKKKEKRYRKLPPGIFEPGMTVLVGRGRQRGVLDQKLKNGKWQVQAGAVRITVDEEALVPIETPVSDKKVKFSYTEPKSDEPAKLELNLRGMRAEEALQALRKQIDKALLQGLYEFGIVHGKGDGILQSVVGEYLRESPEVMTFNFAAPEAGGTGKTLVWLKR